jgi:hypothetical protein
MSFRHVRGAGVGPVATLVLYWQPLGLKEMLKQSRPSQIEHT